MKGCILLVRHGETEWNVQRRYQGQSDSPLTERGIAQAHATGRLLGGSPDAEAAQIIASPLGRAQRTAEIIRDHLPATPEVQVDNRLRELSLGSWDGLTYEQIAACCPGVFDGRGRYDWYFRAPDGEQYDAFVARLADWLCEEDAASAIVVVTHGIVSRLLRGLYARLPRETALMLPVPQDRVFRLSGGSIEELPVSPPPADRLVLNMHCLIDKKTAIWYRRADREFMTWASTGTAETAKEQRVSWLLFGWPKPEKSRVSAAENVSMADKSVAKQ